MHALRVFEAYPGIGLWGGGEWRGRVGTTRGFVTSELRNLQQPRPSHAVGEGKGLKCWCSVSVKKRNSIYGERYLDSNSRPSTRVCEKSVRRRSDSKGQPWKACSPADTAAAGPWTPLNSNSVLHPDSPNRAPHL